MRRAGVHIASRLDAVNSGPLYHRLWKRPGTITLHFGEPIEPGLPREEVEARVHAAINVLNS